MAQCAATQCGSIAGPKSWRVATCGHNYWHFAAGSGPTPQARVIAVSIESVVDLIKIMVNPAKLITPCQVHHNQDHILLPY